MKNIIAFLALVFCFSIAAKPIQQHPQNPHYFQYKGEPVVLVTSAEHYGAIINPDFDFETYLQTLKEIGLNHTRVFMGDYVEPPNAFCIVHNTLSPAPGRFLPPWKRSDEPGYSLGGNKFDLDEWNPDYFERAHKFFTLAEELDIIVEATFFFEGPTVEHHPMHPSNNINNTTAFKKGRYLTLYNGNVLERQEEYCRKLVREFNRYDNIILNICNEPWFNNHEIPGFSSPPSDEVKDWIYRVSQWIVEEESQLPNQHLLSIDYTNEGKPIDAAYLDNQFKHITVFSHHYDRDAQSLALNYHHPVIFSFNETGLMDVHTNQYRVQGWKYMLSGGALYNNLDFTYLVGHEDGSGTAEFSCGLRGYTGCGDPDMKSQLAVLLDFMNSIDFINMKPNKYVVDLNYGHEQVFPLVDEGHQYAVYFIGGGTPKIIIAMPQGTYKAEWINPTSGELLKEETVNVTSDNRFFIGPEYTVDIALRIKKL